MRTKAVVRAVAFLVAATLFFYFVPALSDAPARGDAHHFGRALADAVILLAVVAFMIRFVIRR